MNTIDICAVKGAVSIVRVDVLAGEIWREHYTPVIGAAQVEYMLENFQSAPAISRQIQEGYLYFLLRDSSGQDVGYCAIVPRKEELFLSKIYLLSAHRGRGYARQAITFVESEARERKLPRITLTVNKNNHASIQAYQKMGFTIYGTIVQDIGNGFVMDDYAMAKQVPA